MFCYFDNAASTRPYNEVLEFVDTMQRDCYANPSALHSIGNASEKELTASRQLIAGSLGASAKEIIFTSSATEANNLALRGYLKRNPRAGNHIITTRIEHPSVLQTCEELVKDGFEVDFLDVDFADVDGGDNSNCSGSGRGRGNGVINLEQFQNLIKPSTALVSVMFVNNETGAIQPINQLKEIIRSKKSEAVLHVDAVHGFCKLDFNPGKSGVDLATVGSHKLHGPKGAAALFVREGVKLAPVIFGGGQEKGVRSGTENLPAICGFAKAVDLSSKSLEFNIQKAVALKALLLDKLNFIDNQIVINSTDFCSPYIINFSIPGVRSEVMLHHLESVGVIVSTGSACSNKKNSSSHVLMAMGLPKELVDSAIRVSFGNLNTLEEVEYAATQISGFSKSLRRK